MQPRTDQDLKEQQLGQPGARLTGLRRTGLDSDKKVKLAAGALGREDEHGAKTELARALGVSRPTVYAAKATASAVLTRHFDEVPPDTVWVPVDSAQLRRAVVALRVMAPNSMRAIEDLLPILYPDVRVSYGKVQQLVVEAEQRTAEHNARVDLSEIHAGALDEMYSQGQPVLAGIDLAGGYLFGLELRESRSGNDWAEVLNAAKEQGLELDTVVKDAALGIEAGVREVFPDAEQRDDCFHAHYEMGKVRRILEQRAYGAIAREEEATCKVEKLRRTGRGEARQKLIARREWARRQCTEALELHDRFERAMEQAQEAMELVDLERGELRSAEQAQASLEQAAETMKGLDEPRCQKVGKYIFNRASGLAKYMTELLGLLAPLVAHHGMQAVCLACVIWRLLFDLGRGRRLGARTKVGDQRHLLGAMAMLRSMVGAEQADGLLAEVSTIFERRHRASSAIEGFNAALRPFLYVHKGVSQGFLELFRAYHNLKRRRWGRHKGTSAHQCLTGEHVDDWLSVLGYPPSAVSTLLH
jgi:hypothetical protein